MHRLPVTLVLATATIGLTAASAALAGGRAVVPVRGSAACTSQPPVLLSPGQAPRSPLRVDLEKLAGRSQTLLETENVAARTFGPTGATKPNTSLNTSRGVVKAGELANGHLPLRVTLRLTGPAFPTKPTFTVKGYLDILNGGAIEGNHDDDHFPQEAVGIGATWRVVKCDEINLTHAKETRTYTLRSIAHGIVELTYRDIVTIDPAHLDLGSQKIGDQVTKFRLVALAGTASGRTTIPLARAVAQTSHTVTKLSVRFRATAPNQPAVVIRTDMIDTDILSATG